MAPRDTFLQTVKERVGTEVVVDGPEEVTQRAHEVGHVRHVPRAFLYPRSTEEVQTIMRLANDARVKIFVCSRGLNWGYGGNNFTDSETYVLILERMNKIVEVNETLSYAVIEPGVSYEQLNAYLKEKGHQLWIDCTDGPPDGSVLGNALDRGIGETPYGDHFGNLCGLEVVLPSGELIHTGGSSPSHELHTWHTHKWGIGPSIDGVFTQSNFGVVTKAGMWLMPEPESMNSYLFEMNDERRLGVVIDTFRKLALAGVVSSKLHLISDFVMLTILTQRYQESVPQGRLSTETLARLRKKYGIARWSGGAALYGTKRTIAIERQAVRRALGRHGKVFMFSDTTVALLKRVIALAERWTLVRILVEFFARKTLTALKAIPYLHQILQGVPTSYFLNHAYFKVARERPRENVDPARDGVGLTWFAPILPFTSDHIVPYLDESRALFEKYDFDFYMALMMLNPRSAICLMGILFDKNDPHEAQRAQELYNELITRLYAKNYQQYRTGIASWNRTWEQAPELKALYATLRKAIDPHGTLAPGKYDIP